MRIKFSDTSRSVALHPGRPAAHTDGSEHDDCPQIEQRASSVRAMKISSLSRALRREYATGAAIDWDWDRVAEWVVDNYDLHMPLNTGGHPSPGPEAQAYSARLNAAARNPV